MLALHHVHPQWHDLLVSALASMDPQYLQELEATSTSWLPGEKALFAAFRLPLSATRYILFGESPYPRAQSANGYAFWDASVGSLWSSSGLSTAVNRATSLRNLIKMLLYARGDLTDDLSPAAIARLDKTGLIQTAADLFQAMMQQGILLLNATLVYREGAIPYHARQWRPFMRSILLQLVEINPELHLILLGKIANKLPEACLFPHFAAEHPYNLSFITNPDVVNFFKPMDLLHDKHND